MNKRQLEKLGIDKAAAKKILTIHGKDRQLLIEKINREREPFECERLRNAISSVLMLIDSKNALQEVLEKCTFIQRDEIKNAKEREKMAYFTECKDCGALLDPGEVCDCKKEEQVIPTTPNQTDEEPAQAPKES
jgi:hypothetical protein